jgi:3-hydroxyisobutyrate dehydrogenase
MGGAMARQVIAAGWPTVLWARRPEVLGAFDAPNVEAAATPAALAAVADLVGVCVWADDDVREVVAGDDGLLAGCRPGTVVAVHSTVSPATCRQLAELAAPRGVAVLDAPPSCSATRCWRPTWPSPTTP